MSYQIFLQKQHLTIWGSLLNVCQVTEGEKIRKGGLEGNTVFVLNLGDKFSVMSSQSPLLLKKGDLSAMEGK